MKFVVYCLKDKQVLEMDSDYVELGQFSSYSFDDWAGEKEVCTVRILYEDVVYDAVVLQVGYISNIIVDLLKITQPNTNDA